MTTEIDLLVQPPEFEIRCNNFVTAVRDGVAPRFPDLTIEAENSTTAPIEELPARMAAWQYFRHANQASQQEADRMVAAARRVARQRDQESATINFAVVDILAMRNKLKSQMNQAAAQIVAVAQQFGSARIRQESSLGEQPFNIHFFIAFS